MSSSRPFRSANRYSWAGEHLVDLEVLHLEQRFEVLAEGVGELLGVHTDVGGDAGQDVVARQQEAVLLAVEADVSR